MSMLRYIHRLSLSNCKRNPVSLINGWRVTTPHYHLRRTLTHDADEKPTQDIPFTPILDSFTLSQGEGFHYIESTLRIDSPREKLQEDRFGLLQEIVRKTHLMIPYQNITHVYGIPPAKRHIPSWEEVKDSMFSGRGGTCYESNVFTNR